MVPRILLSLELDTLFVRILVKTIKHMWQKKHFVFAPAPGKKEDLQHLSL